MEKPIGILGHFDLVFEVDEDCFFGVVYHGLSLRVQSHAEQKKECKAGKRKKNKKPGKI